MSKRQKTTVAGLKSLLRARFNAEQNKQAKLQARLQQELGNEFQVEPPRAVLIRKKLSDWISDVLARRLKRNRRTTPLLSSRDFAQFVPSMIDEISKIEGDDFDAEKRKTFKKLMEATFQNIFEMVHAMVPPHKNPYEEYWRWVTTVLDLASERNILPTELLTLENATDEIMRRMFTKKQFIALSKRTVNKFNDVNVLKKIIIQPMIDMLATELNKDELCKIEQELKAEIMPQLREVIEVTKVAISAWLGEEVERIYAAA